MGAIGAPRVVLFHGLTGAPSELWPLGLALASAGYRVEAPLLPGHGTTPEQLAQTSAEDVLAAARRAASNPDIAVIGGLSMGALLALIVTSERPRTDALVLMAPALEMTGRNGWFMRALGLLPLARIPVLLAKGRPETGDVALIREPVEGRDEMERAAARAAEDAASPGADGRYDRIPVRWAGELWKLQRLAAKAAPRIACPTLMLHGLRDRTASPDSSVRLAELIGKQARTRFFAESPHVLTLGPERGAVAAEVARFLREMGVPRRDPSRLPFRSP